MQATDIDVNMFEIGGEDLIEHNADDADDVEFVAASAAPPFRDCMVSKRRYAMNVKYLPDLGEIHWAFRWCYNQRNQRVSLDKKRPATFDPRLRTVWEVEGVEVKKVEPVFEDRLADVRGGNYSRITQWFDIKSCIPVFGGKCATKYRGKLVARAFYTPSVSFEVTAR